MALGHFAVPAGAAGAMKLLAVHLGPDGYGVVGIGLTVAGAIQVVLFGPVAQAGARFYSASKDEGRTALLVGVVRKLYWKAALAAASVAAAGALAAALLSAFGIIHAYELTPGGVVSRFGFFAAPEFVASYLLLFVLFLAVGWWERK